MQRQQLYYFSIFFTAVGLIVSVYLTIVHYYPSVPLVCSTTGIINCNNVLTSQYSVILGIPLAVLGVVFFLAELAVILILKNNEAFIMLSGIGLAFVAYGIYSEYAVGSICEYCTTVHFCTIALFIIAVLNEKS
jgi:uncharacterized membrane protein